LTWTVAHTGQRPSIQPSCRFALQVRASILSLGLLGLPSDQVVISSPFA
jgi:hypothetical protein